MRACSSVVERISDKDEVGSSILPTRTNPNFTGQADNDEVGGSNPPLPVTI